MTLDIDRIRWDACELEKVTELVSRRVVTEAGRMVVWSQIKKGALVPVHSHSGEQTIQVKQGALGVTLRGVRTVVAEGETLVIPAGAAHETEALEDSVVIDVREGDAKF
jgi:quercetin dioxygenase-like cupin family protein